MNAKRTVAGLLAASAMIVVTAAPAVADTAGPSAGSSPEPAQDNASCVNGHWPGVVDGRPTNLAAGADAAVYLWHDGTGWHLRATHPGSAKRIISGRITSDGTIYAVARHTE